MQIPKIKLFDNQKFKLTKIPAFLESYSFWIIISIIVLIIGGEWGFFVYSKKRISDATKNPQIQNISINQDGMNLFKQLKEKRDKEYNAVNSEIIINPFFFVSQTSQSTTGGSGVKVD